MVRFLSSLQMTSFTLYACQWCAVLSVFLRVRPVAAFRGEVTASLILASSPRLVLDCAGDFWVIFASSAFREAISLSFAMFCWRMSSIDIVWKKKLTRFTFDHTASKFLPQSVRWLTLSSVFFCRACSSADLSRKLSLTFSSVSLSSISLLSNDTINWTKQGNVKLSNISLPDWANA